MALDCIQKFCDEADQSKGLLEAAEKQLQSWLIAQQAAFTDAQNEISTEMQRMGLYAALFRCVIDGPAGKFCATPGGNTHPTLAEAIASLTLMTITDVEMDNLIATAGQTVFTMGAAVAKSTLAEVMVNGAICIAANDYIIAGNQLTFNQPLNAGDEVDVRRFII